MANTEKADQIYFAFRKAFLESPVAAPETAVAAIREADAPTIALALALCCGRTASGSPSLFALVGVVPYLMLH